MLVFEILMAFIFVQFDDIAGKADLMAVEDGAKKSFFSSSRPAMRNRSTVFTIGKRDEILKDGLEAPVIVPHAAQKSEIKVSISCTDISVVGRASHVACATLRAVDMGRVGTL